MNPFATVLHPISNSGVLILSLEVVERVKGSTSIRGGGVESEVLREAPACLHQWVIDAPAGRSSEGTCRLCGEKREFQNYIEGSPWGYDISLEQLAGSSRLTTGSDAPTRKDIDEEE